LWDEVIEELEATGVDSPAIGACENLFTHVWCGIQRCINLIPGPQKVLQAGPATGWSQTMSG
jgi:hypothetical protein